MALHSYLLTRRYRLFFIIHIILPFLKPANYITHNATHLLIDITEGNVSDYIQLPLETQNGILYLSSPPPMYAGVLRKKICKKCWSYPLSSLVLGLKSGCLALLVHSETDAQSLGSCLIL